MSDFLPIILIQSVSTVFLSVFYKYILYQRDQLETQSSKLSCILNKIENMEAHMSILRQNIDDLEEKIYENKSMIQSNYDINNKINAFVSENYDIM